MTLRIVMLRVIRAAALAGGMAALLALVLLPGTPAAAAVTPSASVFAGSAP